MQINAQERQHPLLQLPWMGKLFWWTSGVKCRYERTQNTFFIHWRLCFPCVSCPSKILMTPNEIVRTMLTLANIRSLLKMETWIKKTAKNIAWVICITVHFAVVEHPVSGSAICRRQKVPTYNKNDAENTSSHGDCGFCHQSIIIM